MERKYYNINEEAARQAQSMWSFRDYITGSKTAEYKQLVDEAYNLADKVATEKTEVEIREIVKQHGFKWSPKKQ